MKKLTIKTPYMASLLFALFALFSCKETDSKEDPKPSLEKQETQETVVEEKPVEVGSKTYSLAFLTMEDVLLNGNKILLDKTDFEKIYRKADSTRTDLWECGNPLDFLDEEWMTKTYGKRESGAFEKFDGSITSIYTHNVQFITNNHVVLFDTAQADKNMFKIISANIILDKHTTIENFRKLFPKLEKEETDDPTLFRFRIPTGKDHDDAFLFYFKNGKLDFTTLWFLLC
ncbi:hypothetical protein NAT51_06850 [Flavobacterium amniphilum]|uniref:hypothetical protein n=1 Tax=Flavobacterium amniphilum TaxID=1834035 RepID=UPI00202AB77C|nr:hypothetical protein [Flavobacterium amniphilum]MCL9805231.1 hypothetical protein [Flavobacterium amniphilum]